MKAVFYTPQPENYAEFISRMEANFIGLLFVPTRDIEDLVNKVLNEPGISLYLLDLDVGQKHAEVVLRNLEELSQDKPILALGDGENYESYSKAVFFKSPNIAIAQNYKDYPRIIELIENALESFQDQKQKEVVLEEEFEENLIAIKCRNMFFYESFPHDCFIKISDSRYVQALEANQPIQEKTIIRYLNKGVKFLYVEKDKHIQFLEQTMEKARGFFSEAKEINKRAIMAHLRSLAVIHDYLKYVAVTDTIETFIEHLTENILQCLDKCYRPVEAFTRFPIEIESVVGKSLLTAYLNYFLMKEIGWHAETIQKRFVVASFLQDIFLDNDKLSKVKSLNDPHILDFTDAEIAQFKAHPGKAAELADQFYKFTEISFLVFNHHELPNRKGFPNQPSPAEMQIANCVFNVACNFAAEIDGQKLTKDHLRLLAKDYSLHFNIGNFRDPSLKLVEIFKV